MRACSTIVACVAAVLSIGSATAVSPQFAQSDRPRPWSFPRDHASHPEFATEWWYFTGRLSDPDGDRFGFELTFFRVALRSEQIVSSSSWRTRDLIIAHATLSDLSARNFHHSEKVQRAATGLAGAETERFHVWADSWSAEQVDDGLSLRANAEDFDLTLELDPVGEAVLHGNGGLSLKCADGTQASYYYSVPRIATQGQLRVKGKECAVTGSTWMDHEFFTGPTPGDGLGWNWFSVNLDDGRDIMLYAVRHPDGEVFPFGTLNSNGTSRPLDMEDASFVPVRLWTSPTTGSSYPVSWRIALPREKIEFSVEAELDAQEIVADASVGFAYWEGYCSFRGLIQAQTVTGEGYVELTGYDR
jgi:predicted secreted hydrolase